MNTNNISVFLDVALSLTFFYFVTSMFVSGIVEFINTVIEKRAAFLQKALEKLQNSESKFWDDFKNSPFIKNLEDETDKNWKLWSRKISYLDSSTFVSAIINILQKTSLEEEISLSFINDFDRLKQQISQFEKGTLQEILATLAQESATLNEFELKLANWYNQYMEHVSGWFKRYARLVVMIISAVVTIALNLNTVVITRQLASDKSLRNSIVAMAQKTVKNAADSTKQDSISTAKFLKNDVGFQKFLSTNHPNLINKDGTKNTPTDKAKIEYQEAVAKYLEGSIQGLGLNIGYKTTSEDASVIIREAFYQNGANVWTTIIGWILTVAALSFGAPFWFDLLVKLVNVRNVMKKPEGQS